MSRRAQPPDPRDEPRSSWDVPVTLVLFVIGGSLGVLLIVAFYVLVGVGVERFLDWLGPRAGRVLMGLLGLATFGAGSIALLRFLTGRAMNVADFAKTRVILSCLFFVLIGLIFIFLAVVATEPKGF